MTSALRVASALLAANSEGYQVGLRHGALLVVAVIGVTLAVEAERQRRQATQAVAGQEPAPAVPRGVDYSSQLWGL